MKVIEQTTGCSMRVNYAKIELDNGTVVDYIEYVNGKGKVIDHEIPDVEDSDLIDEICELVNKEVVFPEPVSMKRLLEVREQIQEDIITYLEGMEFDIVSSLCEIVIDNFKNI